MRNIGIPILLLSSLSLIHAQAVKPPIPAPLGLSIPAAATDAPYTPMPILPGGVVVSLYPPR